MALTLSSTQLGKIGETIVGAQLMLISSGRLTPFLPLADDDGVDLVVRDKVTGATVPLQIKCRVAKEGDTLGYTQFDVRAATFRRDAGTFLLAILMNLRNGEVERAWLIPSAELPEIASQKADKLTITPNPSPSSQDRYTPYRCQSLQEVVERLATWLDNGRGRDLR